MLISESNQFVFLHNPKCAGTSIRQALLACDTTSNFFWMYDDWNGAKIDKAHLPLYILRNKYPQYFSLLERYFTFVFVRSPYERYISAFNEINSKLFMAMKTSAKLHEYEFALNEFALRLDDTNIKGWTYEFRHFVRQIDIMYLENKCYADLILKVEELPYNLQRLSTLRPDIARLLTNLPRNNARPTGVDAISLLSDETIQRLNRIYAEDFALFGYRLEPCVGDP